MYHFIHSMHPDGGVPCYIVLFCIMPVDFTHQGDFLPLLDIKNMALTLKKVISRKEVRDSGSKNVIRKARVGKQLAPLFH